MIPFSAERPRERPSVIAKAAAPLCVLVAFAALITGEPAAWGLLLVDAAALWIFGAGAEAFAGRGWAALAVLSGAAGGCALALASGAEDFVIIAAAAATVAAAEVVIVHLTRSGGRPIMSVVLVPWLAGIAEVPAALWALIWAALVVGFTLLGAFGS
ncbi:unannotated protein [freshwater metagenome]|uniref:Unannotated protein n=1 Tax=freshwater metagenome TaxID=449393 RepID=A0A6J7H2K6_9ZZZZ|nr:hypothetical protein [Actinomycetota bacterium]